MDDAPEGAAGYPPVEISGHSTVEEYQIANPLSPPPVEVFNQGEGVSAVDLVKEELKELAANVDTIIPVIGREKSGLAIKYHLPENGKVIDDIGRKVERESKDNYYRNLYTAIDTMIALCDGLYVKPAGVGAYVMLDPQESGFPAKFDARLAVIVGLTEDARARDIVKKVFGNNEMAVLSHAERLSRWMSNTNADLESELWQLGN